MKRHTFSLVFCSIISVMALAFLYLSAALPTGTIAAFGLSIFMLCIATAECGIKWGLISSIVVGFLGSVFMPDKLILFPYALFFGYYPALKLCIEQLDRLPLEWLLKVSGFTAAMLAVYFIMKSVNLISFIPTLPLVILAVATEVAFIVYDMALTRLISLYLSKISTKLRKK